MKRIKVLDGWEIPYGVMGFLYDSCPYKDVSDFFVKMECYLHRDPAQCISNMRIACERFVLKEKSKGDANKFRELQKQDKARELLYPDEMYRLFLNKCDTAGANRTARLEKLKSIICNVYENNDDVIYQEMINSPAHRCIKDAVLNIFRVSSPYHHGSQDSPPDVSLCRRYLRLLHDMLAFYYNCDELYDARRIAIGDLYPVPPSECESHYLTVSFDCSIGSAKICTLCVREKGNETEYHYVLEFRKLPDGTLMEKDKKNVSAYKKFETTRTKPPMNILKYQRLFENEDVIFYDAILPSFPNSLDLLIDRVTMTAENKKEIAAGIVTCIDSLHQMDPPFFHRSISPRVFFVFDVRGHKIVRLHTVETIKDAEGNTQTVFGYLENHIAEDTLTSIYAPEFREISHRVLQGQSIADDEWRSVDIYALGRTLLRVFFGKYKALKNDKRDACCNTVGISAEQYTVLERMISKEPQERPDMDAVRAAFCT